MNRRDFLKHAFQLGAAGLILPATEPIRRYWQLDRTMLPRHDSHDLAGIRRTLDENVGNLSDLIRASAEMEPHERPALTLDYLEREMRALWESVPPPTYWVAIYPGNPDTAVVFAEERGALVRERDIPVKIVGGHRLASGGSCIIQRLPAATDRAMAERVVDRMTVRIA